MRVIPAAFTCSRMVLERAAQDQLVGPGGAVDDGCGAVLAQDRDQLAADAGEVVDREVDRQRGAGAGEGGEVLALRHGRGAHRGSGQDDGLRDLGERELQPQAGGRGSEGGDAGGDGPGDAEGVEAAALLGDGAVERRVAGVDAGNVLVPGFAPRRSRP